MNLIKIPRVTKSTKYYIAKSYELAFSVHDNPRSLVEAMYNLIFKNNYIYTLVFERP